MALLNTDLFVIQRPTDAGNHFKLTASKLREFVESGDTIEYKGSRDFTDNTQDPSTDGTGVVNGDVYVNSATVNGTGAWAANITGVAVAPQDRAIWNGSTGEWDLIAASGDAGIVDIDGVEPIVIDDAVPAEPIISVNDALATDAGLSAGRTSRKGVVPSIAAATDVAVNVGNASPNPDAVVPAELLKLTNEDVAELETEVEAIKKGGTLSALKGTDPIEVTTSAPDASGNTETTVSIKDATTVQKGAVQLQEVGTAVSTSGTVAATPAYVGTYYLVKDFSSFADA